MLLVHCPVRCVQNCVVGAGLICQAEAPVLASGLGLTSVEAAIHSGCPGRGSAQRGRTVGLG